MVRKLFTSWMSTGGRTVSKGASASATVAANDDSDDSDKSDSSNASIYPTASDLSANRRELEEEDTSNEANQSPPPGRSVRGLPAPAVVASVLTYEAEQCVCVARRRVD